MRPVYKNSFSLLLLILMTSACNSTGFTASQSDVKLEVAEKEVPPPTPAATFTPEIATVDQLIEAYFSGEKIDVSNLSQEEWVELSVRLAEKKNADRGVNVLIYDNGSGNPVFLDPSQNNMMVEYDGIANLDKTIEMFVPIAGRDAEGNLQFEVDGQLVSIGASAGVDWTMRVTEYGDPRIDWPLEEVQSHGMTNLEQVMQSEVYNEIIIPAILLKKNLGQLQVIGVPTRRSTFSFLVPETDIGGQPLLARKIIVAGAPTFRLYEEGSDLDAYNVGLEIKPGDGLSEILEALNENWTYYLGLINQDYIYGVLNPHYLIYYQGLVSSSDSAAVCLGEKRNDQDMLSLAIPRIIKARVK